MHFDGGAIAGERGFVAGVIFWALSGLWMWWELKVTRRLGALALAGGVALFAFFLAVL